MLRIYLANATTSEVAAVGQALGFIGTAFEGLGFGDWGIEPSVAIDFGGTAEEAERYIAALFAAYPDEEAVYIYSDVDRAGKAYYRDGRVI